MLFKVSEKNGVSFWKHIKIDRGVLYDSNNNIIFTGTVYQACQKFLKLTS